MLEHLPYYYGSLKAIVAVVLLLFAGVLVAGGPRRAPNLYLAAFLVLVAVNSGIESLRIMTALGEDPVLARLALVTAAADPFFLYYFASIFPERSGLNRPPFVALVGLGAVVIFLLTPVFSGGGLGATGWVAVAWELFTFLVYGVVFARLMGLLRAGQDALPVVLLFFASAVAFVPLAPRIGYQVLRTIGGLPATPLGAVLAVYLPLLFVVGVVALVAARSGSAPRRRILMGTALGAASALLLMGGIALTAHFPALLPFNLINLTYQTGTSIRWWLFSGLASIAVIRYDILGMRLAARRKAARALVGVGVGAGAYLAFLLVFMASDGAGWVFRPIDVAFLVSIIALSPGYRRLIDRVATVAYGVPPEGDPAAKLALYRTAVAQAEAQGRDLVAERGLERLRAELGLDPRVAEVVDRMAAAHMDARLAPGENVQGRYQVGRLLGRGTSGRVFAARDQLLERDVVLKEVVTTGPAGEAAALDEARLACRVDHPNVLRVHDAVPSEGGVLLVTEHLEGGTLAARLEREGSLVVGEAARLFDGVLAGLDAIHGAGILHRDLKPENILLAEDGSPRIGDFGVATLRASHGAAGDDRIWGTPRYMAPEQHAGSPATRESDLFAVGTMMSECTRDPHGAWDAVAARACASDPAARWASAAEMRLALRQADRARNAAKPVDALGDGLGAGSPRSVP